MVSLQYFNQILTVVLEVLDDSDTPVRELALSLIVEMLKNQVFVSLALFFVPVVLETCLLVLETIHCSPLLHFWDCMILCIY